MFAQRLRRAAAALALGLLGAAGLLAGCQNPPRVGHHAAELTGSDWVDGVGQVATPAMKQKWTLVQFFAPT